MIDKLDNEYDYNNEYITKLTEVVTYVKEHNIDINITDIRKIVSSCLYDPGLDFRSFFSV